MKINDVEIKTPHKFLSRNFRIERVNTLANGKTVKEIIANKKKFNLSYNHILGADLKVILDLLFQNAFVTFEYIAEEGTEVKTVYSSDLSRELMTVSSDREYVDVSFELTEQ